MKDQRNHWTNQHTSIILKQNFTYTCSERVFLTWREMLTHMPHFSHGLAGLKGSHQWHWLTQNSWYRLGLGVTNAEIGWDRLDSARNDRLCGCGRTGLELTRTGLNWWALTAVGWRWLWTTYSKIYKMKQQIVCCRWSCFVLPIKQLFRCCLGDHIC